MEEGTYLALGVSTRMHDTVHVEVKIVKLFPIWIGAGGVDGLR